MTLDEMIKELMDVHNLSITQFASKTGLSPTTARAMLIPGRYPNMGTLFKVCKAFEIPPAFFFDRDMTADVFRLLAVYFPSSPEQQEHIRKTIKSLANERKPKS